MLSGINEFSSNVVTNRNPKHRFRIDFKGGFPEPTKPAQTWPLLGYSALRFGKLPQGYIKNVQQYWLDRSNFILSPEYGRVEESVGSNEVSPAIGPTTKAKGQDCNVADFRSILQNIGIRTMNEYYRTYILQQWNLLLDASKYITPSASDNARDKWISLGLQGVDNNINLLRDEEQLIPWSSPVKLVFDTNPPLPLITGGTGYDRLKEIDTAMETYIQAIVDNQWIATGTSNGLSSSAAQQLEAYGMIHDQKHDLIDGLGIKESTQDIFGYPGVNCIERIESSPYIPFRIEWRATIKEDTPIPEPNRLPLGIPFILRLFLRSPAPGGDRSRIHIDLGDKIRMTIEQGEQIRICRKRSESEVKEYFNRVLTMLSNEERTAIIKDFNDASHANLGFLALPGPLTAIDKAEQMLEAYYISLNLYNTTKVTNPGVYSDAIGSMQEQKEELAKLKGLETSIRQKYKELSKKRANRKLTERERIDRALALKKIRDNIRVLQQTVGKNEPLRRKMANLEKILYYDTESVELQNSTILDTPLEIKVTDYGTGIVLFDFNNGKDVHVFKDKHFLNNNTKIKNKLGGKRSGGTGTNRIQVLGKDSYTWTISEQKGNKQIGGQLKLSGNGGSFLFAVDNVNVSDGVIYIPVAVNPSLGISMIGNSGVMTAEAPVDDVIIPSITPSNVYENDPYDTTPGAIIEQENERILITNLPAYSDGGTGQPDVDVSKGTVSWPTNVRGGKIQVDIMPGVHPSTTVNPEDIPGYINWMNISSTTDSTSPGESTIVAKPPQLTNVIYYMLRISFKPNRDKNGNAIGFPLLFRGVINILAESEDWDKPGDENHIHTIIGGGVDIITDPASGYTITMEAEFAPKKKRVVYQVTVTYKSGIPLPPLNRMPDWMVGLRCDIYYQTPENYGTDNWIKVVTDGYITHSENEDMLAVTQPNSSSSPLSIHGFYQYHLTRTTFNVADSMRLLEDKLVSEGVILEGYQFYDALYTLLKNSGFPDSKIGFKGAKVNDTSNIAYAKPNALTDKYLPIAAPGSKHSFIISRDRRRNSALDFIVESLGYMPSGTVSLYVDRDGIIQAARPFTIGYDPRYNDSLMIYRSRSHVESLGGNTQQLNNYIYFSPLNRRRNLEEFYSVLTVTGAPDPLTGKPRTVGVQKKEVLGPIGTNVYLGHHRELETLELAEARTKEELIDRLYFLYNQYTYPREVWTMDAPYNSFITPLDVIFVIPDDTFTAYFDPQTPEDYNSIAWKVIDVGGKIEDDSMMITMTPLNKEEKTLLSLAYSNGALVQ